LHLCKSVKIFYKDFLPLWRIIEKSICVDKRQQSGSHQATGGFRQFKHMLRHMAQQKLNILATENQGALCPPSI